MKLTSTATWFFLLCALVSTAQTEKTSEKLINITQNIDTDIVYSDLDRISVNFTVNYTNQPDKKKGQTNYTISYKCPAPDVLLDTVDIKLDAPINYLTLKSELNQKIQVKGDSVRPIQDNTVMKIFIAFSSVGQLEAKRMPAGNLVVRDYIGTFTKDIYKRYDDRQAFVSSQTSKVMVRNIEIDSITNEIKTFSDRISKNKIDIEKDGKRIQDAGALFIENLRELNQLKGVKDSLDLKKVDLEAKVKAEDQNLTRIIDQKKVKVADADNSKRVIVSTTETKVNSLASNNASLHKQLSALSKINLSNSFTIDTITGLSKISIDSMNIRVLKEDAVVLNDLIKFKYLTIQNGNEIQLNKSNLGNVISKISAEMKENTDSLSSLNRVLALQMGSIPDGKNSFTELDDERIKAVRLRDFNLERSEILKARIDTLNGRISKLEEEGRQLANPEGLEKLQRDKIARNDSLEKRRDKRTETLNTLRKMAKEENKKLIAAGIFQISKLHIQIERGYIERIQVFIPDVTGNLSIFENIHAIGFSSVKNFMWFTKTKLFARLSPDRFVYLSDVFANYENFLENYTRDYCPADTTINDFKPADGFMILKRDTFKNLFDTKVFTDLEGIDSNKPNGLLQFEVSRRFNIKTSRMQIRHSRSDIGWLTYFNAFGSLNKIEKDKRVLELRNEDVVRDNKVISPYYATSLDMRRYQNFGLGGELNLFLFDWPDGKMTSYLDIGAAYGHTPLVQRPLNVADPSIRRDSISLSGHSSTIYPKISVELLSEKRIGFVLSYQYNRTVLYSNNNFKPIASYAKSSLTDRIIEPYARNSHVIECYIRAMPTSSRDGQFFFRARYFIQQRDRNTFFAQLQFGYSYNIKLKGFDV